MLLFLISCTVLALLLLTCILSLRRPPYLSGMFICFFPAEQLLQVSFLFFRLNEKFSNYALGATLVAAALSAMRTKTYSLAIRPFTITGVAFSAWAIVSLALSQDILLSLRLLKSVAAPFLLSLAIYPLVINSLNDRSESVV